VAAKYYETGERRALLVAELFNSIARRYDLINDVQSCGLHRLWKREFVRMAGIVTGERALDVCCGTGDISFALSEAGAEVVGVDFSFAMLDVARARALRAGIPAKFIQADALAIPYPDSSFDVVTISYGLRNLASFEAGLKEFQRLLAPGGRILILDFGKPSNPVLRQLWFSYLQVVIPIFGLVFAGNPAAYRYIIDSLKNYPGQSGVDELLGRLGYTHRSVRNILGGVMAINAARR
jgi:demethylmenaquinone methyltransferase / 2-methoxy-6-polyprenyl-1,4-benzoquinol methylase